MKFLEKTNWDRVFDGWREREASDPGWIQCATKIKGWPDWESWRMFTASQVRAQERVWEILAFEEPMREIPELLVGPYSGWQSRHPNRNAFSFADLLELPEQYEYWNGVRKIQSLISDFPGGTELIGLRRGDNGKIVCLEGHHRAVAIALAAKEGIRMDFPSPPRIALANLPTKEVELLDRMEKRGSTKNPER